MRMTYLKPAIWLKKSLDFFIIVFIFLAIYIPDQAAVLAKIYTHDRWYHLDSFVMGPGWASLNGLKAYVDFSSQYGIGMPFIVGHLANLLGGFSYENVFLTFFVLAGFYFTACYIFLRVWLSNVWLAILGILLALKMQMFLYDASDFFVWKHPSGSVVRYFFDVGFFIFLWLFLRFDKKIFLTMAAFWVGLAVFYITDSGVYLFITWLSFLLVYYGFLVDRWYKQWGRILIHISLPLVVAFVGWFFLVGESLWQVSFWKQMTEYIAFITTQGLDALPFFLGLQEKLYYDFILGCIVAGAYVFTILYLLGLILLKKSDKFDIVPLVISIYGLCVYHYFVFRSAPQSYRAVIIPFVFIVCFWIDWMSKRKFQEQSGKILYLLVVVVGLVLLFSSAFLRYPNVFHPLDQSFADDTEMFLDDLNIGQDVALIDRWTIPQERVTLISSFDVALLVKANRKPALYYFPFLNARFMRMKDFGGIKVITWKQFSNVYEKIEKNAPLHVFIEKKLLLKGLPMIYYEKYPLLTVLVKYMHDHYRIVDEGHYLVALERQKFISP